MAWIKCGYCTFGDMGRWQYEGNLTTFVSPKYMICNNMHFFIYLYIHTYVESKGDKYKRLGQLYICVCSKLASASAFMAEVKNPKQHLNWHRGSLMN